MVVLDANGRWAGEIQFGGRPEHKQKILELLTRFRGGSAAGEADPIEMAFTLGSTRRTSDRRIERTLEAVRAMAGVLDAEVDSGKTELRVRVFFPFADPEGILESLREARLAEAQLNSHEIFRFENPELATSGTGRAAQGRIHETPGAVQAVLESERPILTVLVEAGVREREAWNNLWRSIGLGPETPGPTR